MATARRYRPDPKAGRTIEVKRLRRHLLQSSYPRLQMSLLVAVTAASGLLASFLLFKGGMLSMGLRYPLAVGAAYAVFIALLWLWMRTTWTEYIEDAMDIADSLRPGRYGSSTEAGSRAEPTAALPEAGDDGSAWGTALDALGSGDEIAVPLALIALLVALLAALLLSLLSVVWAAPALFAEVLFDGVLAVGLYRRLRRADARHWLQAAPRHTFWPFVLAAVIAAGSGIALQHHAPQATTLSQALSAQ